MKKIAIVAALLAFTAVPVTTKAQDAPPADDKKEKSAKKETQEIVIRQKGDKEMKLKVEIDGDKITINGKPLSDFKDKDITINKRKITIADGNNMMMWNFSDDGEGADNFGQFFNDNINRNFNFNFDRDNFNSKSAFLGVTTETEGDGVKVLSVVKGSAAEKAGLKKGDIITKVGDEKITSPETLSDVIGFKKPNDVVSITYKRTGKEITTKAVLGKRKSSFTTSPRTEMRTFTFPGNGDVNVEGNIDMAEAPELDQQNLNALAFAGFPRQKKLGLKLQDTEDGNGVKVINVEDSSAAAKAGLLKDDLIVEINGTKVTNTDEARDELVPDEEKKSYKIKALRNGAEMNFEVRIPKKLKTANF